MSRTKPQDTEDEGPNKFNSELVENSAVRLPVLSRWNGMLPLKRGYPFSTLTRIWLICSKVGQSTWVILTYKGRTVVMVKAPKKMPVYMTIGAR